VVGYR